MNLNKLELNNSLEGNSRINEIMSMSLDNNNLTPKPISYYDIDTELTNFVSEKFNTIFGNTEIKTFFFSQQRMSEFTQTWEMVDDNKNILPNFKIVTRENNPKPGSMLSNFANIPGEPFFTIGTFEKWDGNKNITVSCKMKQPYCVDIIYNIKLISNSLTLVNDVNNCVNNEFKSKQSYIIVNGHYMPVTIEDISDESDYDLDERKIFIQNFQLKVAGYIINEKDIIFEENIVRTLLDINVDTTKSNFINYENNLLINFPRKALNTIKFKTNSSYHITNILLIDSNIKTYTISINNILVNGTDFIINRYDRVTIKIDRINKSENSKMTLITV